MGNKTNRLKLNLPQSGDRNWGEAVNSNFRTIDNTFTSVAGDIASLRTELGALNYISLKDGENCLVFGDSVYKVHNSTVDVNGYNSRLGVIYIGSKETISDGEATTIGFVVKQSYGSLLELGELPDFQGYRVLNDWLSGDQDKLRGDDDTLDPPWDNVWYQSDILVKTSTIENNQRVTKILNFPQSLGGYYVPTYNLEITPDSGKMTWTWTKTTTPMSEPVYTDDFQFPLPYSVTGISNSLLGNESQWTKTIDTINNRYEYKCMLSPNVVAGTDLPPSIECMFWYKDNNVWQRIELDYYIYSETAESVTRWYIKICVDSINDNDFANKTAVLIRYNLPIDWEVIATEAKIQRQESDLKPQTEDTNA